MARRRVVAYPKVVYGPHGASRTISGPHEWLPGWSETPPDARAATVAPTAPIPYDRKTLKRMLRERGVTFDERAADSALWRLLDGEGASGVR